MLHESDIDIFGVCETFLNKTINNEIINVMVLLMEEMTEKLVQTFHRIMAAEFSFI